MEKVDLDYYREHWEETNKWLRNNAPESVNKCIDIVTAYVREQLKFIEQIEDKMAEMQNMLDKVK